MEMESSNKGRGRTKGRQWRTKQKKKREKKKKKREEEEKKKREEEEQRAAVEKKKMEKWPEWLRHLVEMEREQEKKKEEEKNKFMEELERKREEKKKRDEEKKKRWEEVYRDREEVEREREEKKKTEEENKKIREKIEREREEVEREMEALETKMEELERKWEEKEWKERVALEKKQMEGVDMEKIRFLFLEINGDLVGINLNSDYGYDHASTSSPDSPPPPLVPICCRLNLTKNGFPSAMRHIKIKDQVYLVGGAFPDPSRSREDRIDPIHQPGWVNYSNQIYKFDINRVVTDINNNTNNDDKCELLIPANDVLIPLPDTLKGPKFALVANLRGTYYFMNSHHDRIPCFRPQVPFERFDATTLTCHEAPIPPLYYGQCTQSSKEEKEYRFPFISTRPRRNYKDNDIPFRFPVRSHFVVDNKLLLFCKDNTLHLFSPDDDPPGWTISNPLYGNIFNSFKKCDNVDKPPSTGLWLSDFNFPSSIGFDSMGLLLAIRVVPYDDFNPEIHHISNIYEHMIYKTYEVHAYVMSKITYEVVINQVLDDVFCDLLPCPASTPLNWNTTANHHLLDLGKGGKNCQQEDVRRICAILTIDGAFNGIAYLFISIFDLQIMPADHETWDDDESEFLEVFPLIKRVFRLNSFDKDSFGKLLIAFDHIPPLDAFII